jgi:hypothetical protein
VTRAGLIAALVACAALAPAQTVLRGPYLQRGTPTSVVVKWRTDVATDSRVAYGTTPALGSQATDAVAVVDHAVTLTGLGPDTLYHYSVGTTSQSLVSGSDCFFVTSPVAGTRKPTRIWVLGDSGSGSVESYETRDAYYAFTASRHTDLWMMLGDNAYVDGTDAEYQAGCFDKYGAMLRKSVLWPTLGNHDGHTANSSNQTGPYYDIFTLPTQGEAGGLPSGTEAYYSFDYANVHLVCLDSYETPSGPGSAMLTWLDADLAATTQQWIVVFFHHPPYTKGTHDSDAESELIVMRQNVCPVLEQRGVDLVLCGHSHVYERSFLIDGHYQSSSTFGPQHVVDGGDGQIGGDGALRKPAARTPHAGCVYVVTGSSSWSATGLALNHPAMFHSEATRGSVVLDVDGDQIDLRFIDAKGVTNDRFTMMKGAPTAVDRVLVAFPPFSTWKYHDAGVDLGTAWRAPGYADGGWASGPGPLGFGEPYIATTVSFGGNPSNIHRTTYFRTTFTMPVDLALVDSVRLYANYDDGFAAFVNGQHVAQSPSLPGPPPTFSQLSGPHEAGAYEAFAIPTPLLVPGANVLAVEVHQTSSTSSDLVWDAAIDCDAFVPLLGSPAAGNGGPGGAPADVLLLNGSSGGRGRGIDLASSGQLTMAVDPPPPASSSQFALFVSIGTPGPGDAYALPSGIGTMVFPPSLLAPAPNRFYFASSFGPHPTLSVLAPPAPWSLTLTPGAPAGVTAAVQGVITDASSALRVTNGVLINVVP